MSPPYSMWLLQIWEVNFESS